MLVPVYYMLFGASMMGFMALCVKLVGTRTDGAVSAWQTTFYRAIGMCFIALLYCHCKGEDVRSVPSGTRMTLFWRCFFGWIASAA